MRNRVNMSGLISHTTPDGKSHSGPENRCRESLKRLEKAVSFFAKSGEHFKTITINDEVTVDIPIDEKGFTTVKFAGTNMKMTIEHFVNHYVKAFGIPKEYKK